ncbi:hypothetical protein [Nitrosospira sp. Nsp13]|uniref:hypothetical protein n=1 Tax=Nitrosospira sp. Nsp13 TaxID=1855332 RepID=UPI000880B11B|nr:hypothetical protein [Nitrosospira sp. Nsp13]SCY04860.1 hypothetical protein SAMN05216308_103180 [Nitrosospira sp. Nsp13]
MAIPMQGAWTVSVKSKNAAFAQRFVIAGADSGNGTYAGDVITPAVLVTGDNWHIQIQNNPGGGFIDSADQIKFPTASGGQYQFDIESNDTGGDEDFNDLILTCSTPITATDFVVYGSATSYSGLCFFPCRRDWLIIDSWAALGRALTYPPIRKAIETLYPERVRVKPIPQPDPPPFVPMMIPLDENRLIPPRRVQVIRLPGENANRARARPTEAARQPFRVRTAAITDVTAGATLAIDRVAIGSILDRVIPICTTQTLAGFPISFEEYDRTGTELGGGAYSGTGNRENLGQTVTDRNGNYVFRFSRSIAEFIEESSIDVGTGEDEVVQSMPDLIAKVLDAMAPGGVAFESAPYWNVPVFKRVDLCFPKPARMGCQGGRNIQSLGAIRLGISDTVFDGDGRITCTDMSLSDVPQARCAAWAGKVRLFGCFIGSGTAVTQYTIRHRRKVGMGFGAWEFYQEGMFLQKIGFLQPQQIGPFDRNLEVVNGGGMIAAKAYDNIEQNLAWAASDWFLKAVINTAGGSPAYAPSPGTVQFQIQGYDAAGNFVVGATDTVTMYIDNTIPDLDLPSVQMGAQTGGDCALFSLTGEPDPAKLTVLFKAVQNRGFLGSYSLTVRKGNIGGFPIKSTTGPAGEASGALSGTYTHGSAVNCGQLFGTRPPDEPLADAADYVTAYIIPDSGNWLSPDQPFCTFSVNVGATMRRTNGYNSAEDSFGPVQYLLGIQQ